MQHFVYTIIFKKQVFNLLIDFIENLNIFIFNPTNIYVQLIIKL